MAAAPHEQQQQEQDAQTALAILLGRPPQNFKVEEKGLAGIAKGEKPYDAAAVTAALTTLAEVSKTFPDHFPAGSETGMDSEAAPAIWQNMDDFKAKSAKLTAAAEAQLASMPADQAGVGAAMQAVGATGGDCHQTYRLKK